MNEKIGGWIARDLDGKKETHFFEYKPKLEGGKWFSDWFRRIGNGVPMKRHHGLKPGEVKKFMFWGFKVI